MFNTLEEQIEQAEGIVPTKGRRLLRYLVVLAVSIAIFVGLYVTIRVL